MSLKCPGSQSFSQPKPENVPCPFCGYEVEIWSDEVKARCPKCNEEFFREREQSCLDWCNFAKNCLGPRLHSQYMENKTITLKQRLIEELEGYFGEDARRIDHAKKVMGYAEELLKRIGGDWHVVIPAALLHDVGIKKAEEKYGSADARHQEAEGAAIARKMLLKYGFKKEHIEEICGIVAHHHSPGAIDTDNFKIVYDADCLVNLKDDVTGERTQDLNAVIDKRFLTDAGKEIARREYGP